MIRWNDNYITGIEKLDKEHQQLFQMADQVLNKLRERGDEANYRIFLVRETLTYITSYFERHAKAEEEYMRKIGYTGYTLHKMLHDEFCNIQLKKYQDIVKRGECSKEEIQDFVGSGIGWLLEHIATADMAIIGKGILAAPAKNSDFEARLEEKINTLLTASLNIAANAKIIGRSYQGEFLGKAVYQKMVYSLDSREITIVSGIESSFLLRVAEMIYGTEVKNEMDLILSSLQLFAANFWRSIGQHFAGSNTMMTMKSNSFIIAGLLSEELRKLIVFCVVYISVIAQAIQRVLSTVKAIMSAVGLFRYIESHPELVTSANQAGKKSFICNHAAPPLTCLCHAEIQQR